MVSSMEDNIHGWRDLTQEELDRAYDQAAYASNREQLLARFAYRSELARAARGEPLRYRYGPTEIESLDIFRANKAEKAPIQIFIHGGAWRGGAARDCAFLSEIFVNAGVHLVVPDFINVLHADGSLYTMVEQVRRAIAWTYHNAASFGGDATRIFISGSSSGAHLAGVALTSDWAAHRLPMCPFKGALLCSGIYDLEPVRRSARGNYVRFSDQIVQELSPICNLERLSTPLVVAYGSLETPEFVRQSNEFAAAVDGVGCLSKVERAVGYNHFEIHETLGDPYDVLGRLVLQQMSADR